MMRRMKAIAMGAFGLLMAAALAIGTQTALAQRVTMDCPYNGTSFLGSCVDTAHCQQKCDDVHGVGQSLGSCSGTPGCCRCYF